MESHWEQMDVPQVLELIHSEFAMKASGSSDSPKTFGEAVSRPDGQEYTQAAIDEVKALVVHSLCVSVDQRTALLGLGGYSL